MVAVIGALPWRTGGVDNERFWSGRLKRVLDAQTEEIRARYSARHPRETLEFFDIEPGMTVVEGLPGGGWCTRILMSYLGSDGELIPANYAMDMWPHFPFGNEEFVERMRYESIGGSHRMTLKFRKPQE